MCCDMPNREPTENYLHTNWKCMPAAFDSKWAMCIQESKNVCLTEGPDVNKWNLVSSLHWRRAGPMVKTWLCVFLIWQQRQCTHMCFAGMRTLQCTSCCAWNTRRWPCSMQNGDTNSDMLALHCADQLMHKLFSLCLSRCNGRFRLVCHDTRTVFFLFFFFLQIIAACTARCASPTWVRNQTNSCMPMDQVYAIMRKNKNQR